MPMPDPNPISYLSSLNFKHRYYTITLIDHKLATEIGYLFTKILVIPTSRV